MTARWQWGVAFAGTVLLTGCAASGIQHPEPPGNGLGSGGAAVLVPASSSAPGSALAPGAPLTPASGPGGCPAGASAFMLSLVASLHGSASPAEAAREFTRHGGVTGYGNPATVWRAGVADSSGVAVTAAGVTLHAVQLPNGRWAIDSGRRCV